MTSGDLFPPQPPAGKHIPGLNPAPGKAEFRVIANCLDPADESSYDIISIWVDGAKIGEAHCYWFSARKSWTFDPDPGCEIPAKDGLRGLNRVEQHINDWLRND